VNNYLTSIVARTLNAAPLIRPRLRGRFDSAAASASLVGGPRRDAPPARTRWHSEPRGANVSSEPSQIDPSDRINKAISNGREPEAALPPQYGTKEVAEWSVEADVTPPQALSIVHPLSEPDLLPEEEPAQSRRIGMPSIRGRTDVAQSSDAKSPSAREVTQPVEEESRQVLLAPRSAERHLVQRVEASTRRPITPATHVLESPPQTVVVGEEWSLEDSSIRLDPGVKPVVSSSELRSSEVKGRQFKAVPVTVYSQIAPLADFGPETAPLRQTPAQPPPTIHVTIGRVEVRAVQQSQSPTKNRASQPMMTLDDYLRRRSQGSAQ